MAGGCHSWLWPKATTSLKSQDPLFMARGAMIVCGQSFLKPQMITHYVNSPGGNDKHIPKFVFGCIVQVFVVAIMDISVDCTVVISKPMACRIYYCVGTLNNCYLLSEMITTNETIYICPLPQHIVRTHHHRTICES